MSHNTDSLSDRLCAACNYRDHKMVRELIVEQKADPNKESELGYLPLNICADSKDSEGVRLLIELGADINIHDSNGFTPLSCAAFSGDYKSACLLLNAGADVHNPGKDCKHYVMAAAVTGGSLETVRAIVEAGGDIEAKDCDNWTPIMYAVRHNDINMVRLLLELGSDPHAVADANINVVYIAASNGFIDILKIFLDLGMDIDTRDSNGNTGLLKAASYMDRDTVISLVKLGADPDAKNSAGEGLFDLFCYTRGQVDTELKNIISDIRYRRRRLKEEDFGNSGLNTPDFDI